MNILTLKPVDLDDPPDGLAPDADMRGIAICWRPSSPPPVKRRRSNHSETPRPAWQVQYVGFQAVSPSGEDEPPRDAAEQAQFVRAAYALVACSHPIPSDAEVRYQVRW